MLKPSNYSLWAIRMQIILEANGLWEMIEPLETTQSNNKKDKTAIAFLYIPTENICLNNKNTKHRESHMDALKTRHIGKRGDATSCVATLPVDFEMLPREASVFNESARRKAQEQDDSWFEGSTKDI
ncbi:zinc finger, CCHC-type containing protein [Tanacetum coccineum]